MPKTPGPVESSAGRSNPYIKTGINKSFLTPFRRVGLSKTRKSANNLNLSYDSNLNTSATSSEASPHKSLSPSSVEKTKPESLDNGSLTKTRFDVDISSPKCGTSVDVNKESVEKPYKCNARESKPEKEVSSITSNAYDKQSKKDEVCKTTQNVEMNAVTNSKNIKENYVKNKRKRPVEEDDSLTYSNEPATVTPGTGPEKMVMKQDKSRTLPKLENKKGNNAKTANKRRGKTARHVSSDDSEDEPLVNVAENETSVSPFVDPVGSKNIKTANKRRIKRILSEDSEENFSPHDANNVNKDVAFSDSQNSSDKKGRNRSELNDRSVAAKDDKFIKHTSEDFAATPVLLGFDDSGGENSISSSSFNSSTKSRYKPNALCEYNYHRSESINQRSSNSTSDVSQKTRSSDSGSEETMPRLERTEVETSQHEQSSEAIMPVIHEPEHVKTLNSPKQQSLVVNKPKKTYMKRSLSMKKSSSQQTTVELGMMTSNTIRNCSVKLTKVQLPADQKLIEVMDFDVKREMELISKFEKQITEKRKLLEELKQAEVNQKKHNVIDLKQLTLTWKNGCISALNDLLPLLQQHGDINMERLLQNLKVPEQLISLSPSGELR